GGPGGRGAGGAPVGAGIVWHPEGLILTNAHVARGDVSVVLGDGRARPARLVARDPGRDLAALVGERGGGPRARGRGVGPRSGAGSGGAGGGGERAARRLDRRVERATRGRGGARGRQPLRAGAGALGRGRCCRR